MQDKLVVYGADDCPDTQRTRRQLQSLGVPHEYVNVSQDDDAEAQVKEWNGGRRVTPTVVLPSGNVVDGRSRLAAPSDPELEEELRGRGILQEHGRGGRRG